MTNMARIGTGNDLAEPLLGVLRSAKPALPRNFLRIQRHGPRVAVLALMVSMLVSALLVAMPAESQGATPMIRLPFPAGTSWMISQGYNTSPTSGGTHWNCDSDTLHDQISQTSPCRAGWQYKHSVDLRLPSGSAAGRDVISPVTGTIRWIDESTGGMSINLGNGYAVAFFHATLDPGISEGQPVVMGQHLGTIAPPGEAGNGGSPHIHLTVWQTNDGGNWSRNSRPFTGNLALDGYELPFLGDDKRNQHHVTMLTSSNTALPTGSSGIPVAPSLRAPGNGATVDSPISFSWNAVEGATEYQVVVDGQTFSAWTDRTTISMSLSNGSHTWRVRARNDIGTGPLSSSRTLSVAAVGAVTGPTITSSSSTGEVGDVVTVGGSGFTPGETATLRWRSQTIRTFIVPASGMFSTQFTIPQAPHGTWAISVTGNQQATTDFRVIPSLERDPVRGEPGTPVTITVNGFGPNETVRLNWRSTTGPELARVTTNSNGTGTVTINLPDGPAGWTDYTGFGLTSRVRAWGAIQILSDVTLSQSTAEEGDRVTVTGRGFPANKQGTARIGANSPTSGTQLCTLSTSADGRASCTFSVPDLPTGKYSVSIVTSDGVNSSASLTIEGPPAISVTPGSAASGVEVSVRVGGFGANESVSIRWQGGSAWRTVTTDGNGSATVSGTVPQLPAGTVSVTARNSSGSTSVSTPFVVERAPDPGDTTMTGPGTYTVVATREGLVGGMTSNGHIIVPDDHFVSLPACTTTSCPWLTPGQVDERWGVRTECGNKCYVMAINETTGACEVAPVWDTGPWFTVDDWWKPGPDRYLNQLPSNPNYLAQGVTGAGAARNGLDVGYGIGPSGIGSSNRYTTVGNASVIDLADGTWTAIGLDFNKGIDVIDVELLWQTGQSPEAAAAECGHPLDQGGDTGDLNLSTTQGKVGDRVRVSGGAFDGGETVRVYVGSTERTAVATVTANSSGTIDTTITVPETRNGNSAIISVGSRSGTRQESIFSIVPSITRSPTSGPPGSTVSIGVHGYGANEDVRVRWDNSTGTMITTIRTNANGAGSGTFTVPFNRSTGWNTYFARGIVSDVSSYGAFNITQGTGTPPPKPDPTPTPGPSPVDEIIATLISVLNDILANTISDGPASSAVGGSAPYPGSNPSFSGSMLPIIDASGSALPTGQQTNDASRAIDGDTGTSWATTGDSPERATLQFDLGEVRNINGVKWMYSQSEGVDQQILQVSTDGDTWDQQVITSARLPLQWEGFAVDQDARYVRLILTNDTDLPVLGYIAEIQVWGDEPAPMTFAAVAAPTAPASPDATATPTTESTAHPGSNPSFGGQPLSIAGASDSALPSGQETTDPMRAVDGDHDTSWSTTGGDPERAIITFDLGEVKPVTGVKWMYDRSEGIDRQILEVSADGASWDQIVITSARQPLQWEGVTVDQDIRYVRLILTNDAGLPVLGHIAEVQIWGDESTSVPATSVPTPTAETRTGSVINTDGSNLNCRSEPNASSDIVGRLAPGSEVTITGQQQDGWLPVECQGASGWVSADFVGDAAPPARTAVFAASAEPGSIDEKSTVVAETPSAEATGTPVPTEQPIESPEAAITDAATETTAATATSTSADDPTATVAPTEAPTEIPTVAPTEVPTEAPTAEPVLQTREIVVPASADVSVNGLNPGATEDPVGSGTLSLGGADGHVAGATFDIPGIDGGEITNATLVLQGAGDASGSGGPVHIASGARVDDYGTTWNSLQALMGSTAGSLDWVGPGTESVVNVTGWIPAEGSVSVILPGTAGQQVTIASVESGAPAYLVLTIEEWVAPES